MSLLRHFECQFPRELSQLPMTKSAAIFFEFPAICTNIHNIFLSFFLYLSSLLESKLIKRRDIIFSTLCHLGWTVYLIYGTPCSPHNFGLVRDKP